MDLGLPVPAAGRCAPGRRRIDAVAAAHSRRALPARPLPAPAPRRRARPPATARRRPPRARYLQASADRPTRLWLLVASDPPRVVDVDRGTRRPVDGLPAGESPYSVAGVGEHAVLTADRQVFVLDRWSPRARPVGVGDAMPSLDGRGIWLLERGRRCTLRQIGLDSLARRPPRRVPCDLGLLAESPAGLLAWTETSPRDRPTYRPKRPARDRYRGSRGVGSPGPLGRPRAPYRTLH